MNPRFLAKKSSLVLVLFLALGSLGAEGIFSLSPPVAWGQRARLQAEEAFNRKLSRVFLTAEGRVLRILSEDREGAPHQRFILRLSSGHTLLVLHNIAVSTVVPLTEGGWLRVRGEYRWNEKGGLLHFTHQPRGQPRGEIGGWIVTEDGRLYR